MLDRSTRAGEHQTSTRGKILNLPGLYYLLQPHCCDILRKSQAFDGEIIRSARPQPTMLIDRCQLLVDFIDLERLNTISEEHL